MAEARATGDERSIRPSWTIHEVLRRYPALLDTLVAISPAFAALRNPIRRRVQARLATVAHAAAIAGLSPEELAHRLNVAAGMGRPGASAAVPAPDEGGSPAQPSAPEPAGEPAWLASGLVAGEFDARPLLRAGGEPFGAIMRAASSTPLGAIFRLRATFDPVPLYGALARRGFTGWGRQLGDQDWEIFFLRRAPRRVTPPVEGEAAPGRSAPPRDGWSGADSVVTIDVGELVPPEPMIKILEALDALPPGRTLLVRHVRRPIHLYPRLDELGARHQTRDREGGGVEILITKPAAGEASR